MNRPKIVVIDDSQTSIDVIRGFLETDYDVKSFTDSREGLHFLETSPPPQLVLLDVQMPNLDGFTLCKKIKTNNAKAMIPIILITSFNDSSNETLGLQLGADDYMTKPLNPGLTRVRIKLQLELQKAQKDLEKHKASLEEMVRERTQKMNLVQDITIECMATLAEKRDNDGGLHITRITNYITIICEELVRENIFPDLDPESHPGQINLIAKSAMLHDIGKVGIPDEILQKKEELTVEEFDLLKDHTRLGRDALLAAENELGSTSYLTHAREIAYSHHERWNGSGYPEGLKGEEIPLPSRLMGVADVYDNLITSKSYKNSISHNDAVQFIRNNGGILFDPALVKAFMACEEEIRLSALENYDNQEQKSALEVKYSV